MAKFDFFFLKEVSVFLLEKKIWSATKYKMHCLHSNRWRNAHQESLNLWKEWGGLHNQVTLIFHYWTQRTLGTWKTIVFAARTYDIQRNTYDTLLYLKGKITDRICGQIPGKDSLCVLPSREGFTEHSPQQWEWRTTQAVLLPRG